MRWAHDTYGDGLVRDRQLRRRHARALANVAVPGIEITLLDTGYLFAETEWFADDLRNRYGLNLRVMYPEADLERNVWQFDTERLLRGPQGRAAQPGPRRPVGLGDRVCGAPTRRRAAPRRSSTKTCSRASMKINPLAAWTDDDVAAYAAANDLPEHPLARPRLRLDRLLAVHAPGRRRRGRPRRALGRHRETECGLHL